MMRREILASAWPLAFGLVLVGVPVGVAAVHQAEGYVAGTGIGTPDAGIFPTLWGYSLWLPILFAVVSAAEIVAALLGAWGPRGGLGLARRLWRAHAGLLVLSVIAVVQAFVHPAAGAAFYSPHPGRTGIVLGFGVAVGWLIVLIGLALPVGAAPVAEPDR